MLKYWLVLIASLAFLVWQVTRDAPTNQSNQVDVTVGDRLCFSGLSASQLKGKDSFLIAVTSGCPSCSLSRPFQEDLEQYGRAHGMPTVYAVNANAAGEEFARELAAMGKSVIRAMPQELGVTIVPTFLRIGQDGLIKAKWTGLVEDELHDRVLAALSLERPMRSYQIAEGADLAAYVSDQGNQIVALSETQLTRRGVAKFIDLNDFAIRVRYELDIDRPVVLDCTSIASK